MGPGYIVSRFRVDFLIYSLEDLVGTTGLGRSEEREA
jgi:hypothetical protein